MVNHSAYFAGLLAIASSDKVYDKFFEFVRFLCVHWEECQIIPTTVEQVYPSVQLQVPLIERWGKTILTGGYCVY